MERQRISVAGRRLLAVAAFALAFAVTAGATQTNYYHVKDGNPTPAPPYATWTEAASNIQDAVSWAESDWNTDTNFIVLVTDGVYVVSSEITVTQPITLISVNGKTNTIIKGAHPVTTNRCLRITGSALVDGFTITNGYVTNLNGGGILMSSGTVQNCTIAGHFAVNGCGVYMTGGMVSNCFISGNQTTAAGIGGGVYVGNGARVTHCDVLDNDLGIGVGTGGAGVYVVGTGKVRHSLIGRNTARKSVGVVLSSAPALIEYSVISNNFGYAGGGGTAMTLDGGTTARNCTFLRHTGYETVAFNSGGAVENCVIRDNQAVGAVLDMNNGALRNCLVMGNTTTAGAINMGDNGTIENCTVARNYSSTAGGGMRITVSDAVIRNNVVYDNDAPANSNCFFSFPGSGTIMYNCSDPALPGEGNIGLNPMFVKSGYGYGTNAYLCDYRLLSGSPCVNAGLNQTWMTTTLTNDLAGDLRILPAGGVVNIGAYELPIPLSGTVIIYR